MSHHRVSITLLAVALLAGCGASPSQSPVKEGIIKAPKATKSTTVKATAPTKLPDAPQGVHTGATAQSAVNTAPGATPTTPKQAAVAPPPPAPGMSSIMAATMLDAVVLEKKNGSFLGMGTFKATIEASNSGDAPATGLLKVTFKNGEKDSPTDPQLKLVTLAAHASQTFEFEDKKWSTDSVECDIAAVQPGQALAAFVKTKKNGVFLGAGTFKTTIEVINPGDAAKTGDLIVQFTNGDKLVGEQIHTAVNLGPHETKDFDFEEKKWSTDNVIASVE